MEERWKDVQGYETLYMVSTGGRIKSLITGKMLKPKKDKLGYCRVVLYKNKKSKRYLVHRLVAQAFIDNPNVFPIINHKDENPGNNNVENLEWCTYSYNTSYGTARIRSVMNTDYKKRTQNTDYPARDEKLKKPVLMMKDGKVVKEFDSIKSATKELGGKNAHGSNITYVCKGKRKRAYGYQWKYKEKS